MGFGSGKPQSLHFYTHLIRFLLSPGPGTKHPSLRSRSIWAQNVNAKMLGSHWPTHSFMKHQVSCLRTFTTHQLSTGHLFLTNSNSYLKSHSNSPSSVANPPNTQFPLEISPFSLSLPSQTCSPEAMPRTVSPLKQRDPQGQPETQILPPT